MRTPTPSFAVFLLAALAASAFAEPGKPAEVKQDFLARKVVSAASLDGQDEVYEVVHRVQTGQLTGDELKEAVARIAPALELNDQDQRRAIALYGRGSVDNGAALGKKMDRVAGALGSLSAPQDFDGGVSGAAGPGGTAQPDLAALNAQKGAQTGLNPAQAGAPPAVLGDIVKPPEGFADKYIWPYFGGQSKRVFDMLATKPTPAQQQSLDEAHQYVVANGGFAGQDKGFWTVGEDGTPVVRANYSDLGGNAYGATIPLPAIAQGYHNEEASITLDPSLQNAPVEVRALVVGHEELGHTADIHSGFMKNPGSHIPSEVRAAVIDGYNYLAFREKLDDDRLKQLQSQGVWQQADLKARIILNKKIWMSSYQDSRVSDDAVAINDFRDKHPSARAPEVIRFYVKRKYAKSGEEGMENIDLKDGSPIGQFNKDVDALIARIQAEADQKGWLKYDD